MDTRVSCSTSNVAAVRYGRLQWSNAESEDVGDD